MENVTRNYLMNKIYELINVRLVRLVAGHSHHNPIIIKEEKLRWQRPIICITLQNSR